ncbi:hypothetical protein P3339_16060 [Microbulbifer sp. MLAF003]|uniref:hypothetical protein n=1 Tax=Microbulbifer sp. MLAF003 TaxID=3032582 RepID=UPI0024AE05AB|nr:hypothetical protein [Microbulbifer sp. MLAF003]WHI49958.1 hypothetical protein P3339_16060 [Microbulbifer sp. MLAF003]
MRAWATVLITTDARFIGDIAGIIVAYLLGSSLTAGQIAIAMSITIDSLVFDEDERGPDEQLRLQFEAIS